MKRTPEAVRGGAAPHAQTLLAEVGRFTVNTDSGEQWGAVKVAPETGGFVIMVLSLGPLPLKVPAERPAGQTGKHTGCRRAEPRAKDLQAALFSLFPKAVVLRLRLSQVRITSLPLQLTGNGSLHRQPRSLP